VNTQDRLADLAGALLRTRRLTRAPVWLYRARLGAVFGHRLPMLEHIGRVSGERRYVVLEVLDHPAPGEYVVASGFGLRAQWLRNVMNNPHVRVYVASRRPQPATARLLGPEQAAGTLRRYAAAHPQAWQRLEPVLERTLGVPISEAGTSLRLVRLTDHSAPLA
jgi:deazaflavin-dependent oxidoreductase (nitroreductase family)